MPIKKSLFERIRFFFFGSKRSNDPVTPDMEAVCSKCEIMKLFIDISKKNVKNFIKASEEPPESLQPQQISRRYR